MDAQKDSYTGECDFCHEEIEVTVNSFAFDYEGNRVKACSECLSLFTRED